MATAKSYIACQEWLLVKKTYRLLWGDVVFDLDVHEEGGIGDSVTTTGQVDVPVARHHTADGQRVWPNKVILVEIFVHDLEADKGQLREHDNRLQVFIPLRVEACSGEKEREKEEWPNDAFVV